MKKSILVIAAHPDDEVLGCGGAVARLVNEGHKAYVLILGEGITARGSKRSVAKFKKEIRELKVQAKRANKIIGVSNIFHYEFPDNRFDSVALLDIVKIIEKVKNKVNPYTVFTHHYNDLNVDHRITYSAVLAACRPLKGDTVKEIYSFEIPSSTEWNYPNKFNPNCFIDISQTLELKIKALQCYRAELKKFPHPRSEEVLRVISRKWGSVVGYDYIEAFELIRRINGI